MSDKKMTCSLNGMHFSYEKGKLSVFRDELSNDPIRIVDVNLKDDKALQMEAMWIAEKMDNLNDVNY